MWGSGKLFLCVWIGNLPLSRLSPWGLPTTHSKWPWEMFPSRGCPRTIRWVAFVSRQIWQEGCQDWTCKKHPIFPAGPERMKPNISCQSLRKHEIHGQLTGLFHLRIARMNSSHLLISNGLFRLWRWQVNFLLPCLLYSKSLVGRFVLQMQQKKKKKLVSSSETIVYVCFAEQHSW